MSPPRHQPWSASKGAAVPKNPTSSFAFRFHKEGQANVSFRKQPDLTSDPNQVWVALDASEIKFVNYTPENMPDTLDSASPQEDGNEAELPSPKRQRKESTAQSKAVERSSRPTGFRVDKPVQANVPPDVWRTILKESHPTVLLIVKNLNHQFDALLQEQSIWRASRTKLHGEDMPGPPGEMTEQRYAHLLYGQGCDFRKSKCGSNVTKKVYWPFLLRMCDACFRRKTVKDKSIRRTWLAPLGNNFAGDLIPAGMTSSGKYTRTRRPSGSGWEEATRAVYLRSDLEVVASKAHEMNLIPFAEADWGAKTLAGAQALMAQCTRIEDFQSKFVADQPRHRDARAEFFAAQAAKLTPPLGKDVMEKIMAYKMSLDSNHEPTPRSWGDLKKKLLPHRAAAEELLDLVQQNERHRRLGVQSSAIQKFSQLHVLRSHPFGALRVFLSEQIVVLSLGQKQLSSCKNRAVADADLVLLVLKGVFDTYQQLPAAQRPLGTNWDLSQGTYRLTLDDARMLVHEVIKPEVRGWNDSVRSRMVLERFKCVGCVRKDCTTRYTFDALFQHIHEKHATYVAEGEDFHKLYRPFDDALHDIEFPWYTIEWPGNLPIAASHQEVSKEKKWLADAEVAYVPVAPPETAPTFLNRRPFDNPDLDVMDFEGNLTYAVAKLRPTILNVLCQMRIALQYALDRYAVTPGLAKPSVNDFIACLPKVRAANEDFNLTFSCGVCKRNPDIPQSAIHTRPETLLKLQAHFNKTHSVHDWTTSFVELPSDAQLAKALQDADEALKKEKRATEEREASLAKNPRKKADPNAKVILQKPEAMAIFEELFPRAER